MTFDLQDAIEILSRTPLVFRALLHSHHEVWLRSTEGPETWSPFAIVGHLIHGERTDWIPRARTILDHGEAQPFEPFDRFAQFAASRGKTVEELLDTFAVLRAQNLNTLESWHLTPADLARRGTHPELGPVTLEQLLATWVVHDLGHIAQASRVMAKQYRDEVGPWRAYLPVLDR